MRHHRIFNDTSPAMPGNIRSVCLDYRCVGRCSNLSDNIWFHAPVSCLRFPVADPICVTEGKKKKKKLGHLNHLVSIQP